MLTTQAGGLGINLHGANRVVMFDVSFNPSDDSQSIFRIYRLGQEKECYIYRFVARGGMEQTTYIRSVIKLSLSRSVVDEQQTGRPFVRQDASSMYKFTPSDDSEPTEVTSPPSDPVLRNLLVNQKKWLHYFIEHDSLLANQIDEDLNDEEKDYARTEVISKPVPEKKQGKQKPAGKRTGVTEPSPIGFDSVAYDLANESFSFVDRLFTAIQSCNPLLSPKEVMTIISVIREDVTEISKLSNGFIDNTSLSGEERNAVSDRYYEISSRINRIVGKDFNYDDFQTKILDDSLRGLLSPRRLRHYSSTANEFMGNGPAEISMPGPSRLCNTRDTYNRDSVIRQSPCSNSGYGNPGPSQTRRPIIPLEQRLRGLGRPPGCGERGILREQVFPDGNTTGSRMVTGVQVPHDVDVYTYSSEDA